MRERLLKIGFRKFYWLSVFGMIGGVFLAESVLKRRESSMLSTAQGLLLVTLVVSTLPRLVWRLCTEKKSKGGKR